MNKKIELIDIRDLTYNDRFCNFTVIYNETEYLSFFSSKPFEKTFIRQASGSLLDNLAQSIIAQFNDNGKSIYDELGNGLHSVIERKIRLQISRDRNNIPVCDKCARMVTNTSIRNENT